MANIQDSSQLINISIVSQGYAVVGTVSASPNPVMYGGSSTVTAPITNTGNTDTIYADFYVGGTFNQSFTNTVSTGSAWSPAPSISLSNIISTTVVEVRAGHLIYGSQKVQDSTGSVTITLIAQGHAIFSAGPTINPPAVEPGGSAVIQYTVQNTGGLDTIWGELYNELDAPIAGTYWEQSIANGATVGPISITIDNIQTPIVGWHLKIGHVE